MTKLLPVLALLACSASLSACGAFADVFEEPDGEPTLEINPDPVLFQAQDRQLVATFLKDPPWVGDTGGTAYITDCDPGDDIGCINSYDGVKTITVRLQAQRDARIGQRRFEITAAFDKSGQKQQTHTGWAWLFVIPVGTDGGVGDGGSE